MIEVAVWEDWSSGQMYVKVFERDRFGSKGRFNFHTGTFERKNIDCEGQMIAFPQEREELLRKLIEVFEADVKRAVDRRGRAILKEEEQSSE